MITIGRYTGNLATNKPLQFVRIMPFLQSLRTNVKWSNTFLPNFFMTTTPGGERNLQLKPVITSQAANSTSASASAAGECNELGCSRCSLRKLQLLRRRRRRRRRRQCETHHCSQQTRKRNKIEPYLGKLLAPHGKSVRDK